MKGLTIKEPWATLITEGYKEYEFRTWKTKYRGDILIHAGKGIDTSPKQPEYSARDNAILARAEAEDIIASGYDEVVEETNRLAQIGVENMSAREKAVFSVLAEHRQKTERNKAFD